MTKPIVPAIGDEEAVVWRWQDVWNTDLVEQQIHRYAAQGMRSREIARVMRVEIRYVRDVLCWPDPNAR